MKPINLKSIIKKIGILSIFCILTLSCSLNNIETAFYNPKKIHIDPQDIIQKGLVLNLTLNKEVYPPGEAVICDVSLENTSEILLNIRSLDHSSVEFYFLPKEKDSYSNMQIIEPVYSDYESANGTIVIDPKAKINRNFVFTNLTFNRGEFVFQATYTIPQSPDSTEKIIIYSKPVFLNVKGEKVFTERYLNGIITKESAIELAKREIRDKIEKTSAVMTIVKYDAILIKDEAGFLKWWVNITYKNVNYFEKTKSFFIDAYRGVVWKEAVPFKAEDMKKNEEPNISKDSKFFQELREKKLNNPVDKSKEGNNKKK